MDKNNRVNLRFSTQSCDTTMDEDGNLTKTAVYLDRWIDRDKITQRHLDYCLDYVIPIKCRAMEHHKDLSVNEITSRFDDKEIDVESVLFPSREHVTVNTAPIEKIIARLRADGTPESVIELIMKQYES